MLTDEVRKQFENPEARVSFQRIQASLPVLSFRRNQTEIEPRHAEVLDQVGQQLQRYGLLQAEIAAGGERNEIEGVAQHRAHSIGAYLADKWKVAPERISLKLDDLQEREASMTLKMGERSARVLAASSPDKQAEGAK